MRHIVYLLLLCLPILADASIKRCPSLTEIRNIPGEYTWITDDSRFEGYFASPQPGRGLSTHLTGFVQARWKQLSNLAKSGGILECDYIGNHGGEIIRFVQIDAQTLPEPKGGHWSCAFNPEPPSNRCTCNGNLEQCTF